MFQKNDRVQVAQFEDLPATSGIVIETGEDFLEIEFADGSVGEIYEDQFGLLSLA